MRFELDADLLKDIKELSNNANTGDFEELPLGKYEVEVKSLELTESKKGYPMTKTVFKVLVGDYTNRLIFKNSVVFMGDQYDKFRLSNEVKFLKSLKTKQDVTFSDFDGLARLCDRIMANIEDYHIEYLLEITENKGFRNYTIKEVYNNCCDDEETPY